MEALFWSLLLPPLPNIWAVHFVSLSNSTTLQNVDNKEGIIILIILAPGTHTVN